MELPDLTEFNILINIVIAALPVWGTFKILDYREKNNKLSKAEVCGATLIFWGFILYAFLINLNNTKGTFGWWLGGWIIPLLLGIVVTIAILIKYKHKARQKNQVVAEVDKNMSTTTKNLKPEIKIELLKNRKLTVIKAHDLGFIVAGLVLSIGVIGIALVKTLPNDGASNSGINDVLVIVLMIFAVVILLLALYSKPQGKRINEIDKAMYDLYVGAEEERQIEIDRLIEKIYKDETVN